MADPELQTALEEAQIFLDGGKLDDARKTLAEALSRWPTDPNLIALGLKIRDARMALSGSKIPAAAPPEAALPAKSASRPLALYAGLAGAAVLSLFLFCGRNEEPDVLAAFDAYQRAMESRDLRALKNCLTKAKAADIDLSGDGQDAAAELAFALNPSDVRVAETKVKDGRATLKVEGRFEEVMTGGTLILLKEESVWKVDQVSWRIEFDGEHYSATDVEESSEPMAEAPEEESPEESPERAADEIASAVEEAEGNHAFFPEETAKLSEEALFGILGVSTFPSDAYKELEKRGKKAAALDALQDRLRKKGESRGHPEGDVIRILSEAGQPIHFDWYRETSPKREDESIELLEWEIEVRNGSLYTSGKLHLGKGVVEGYGRKPQDNAMQLTPGSEIEFTLIRESQDLAKKELVIAEKPGENSWADVLLAENLAPGRYSVRPFLHAQFTGSDDIPKSLNYNNQSLKVEIR